MGSVAEKILGLPDELYLLFGAGRVFCLPHQFREAF
jgi:hypothetical protein